MRRLIRKCVTFAFFAEKSGSLLVTSERTRTRNAGRFNRRQNRNQSITTQPTRKQGLCFSCGRSGHWRVDCPKQMVELTDRNKNTQMSIYSYFRKADECGLDEY